MTDTANRLASLPDETLWDLHARLDAEGLTGPAAVEAHHLVTTEMLRRNVNHGHEADEWSQAVVLVETAEVDGPDEIDAPEGMEKAWRGTLAEGGTVSVLLTVDGYVLKADSATDGPDVGSVHVDTVMGSGKRKRKGSFKPGPLVDPETPVDDSVDEVGKADGYPVPREVRAAARQAVRWIEEGRAGDGFTAVGRERARQLADGGPVGHDTLVKMRAYFARHVVDKDAEAWGDKSEPTPGMVAWYAWGGDPGRAWVNGILGDVEKAIDP